ncbi:sensor histidine kinase [Chloroflexota bacterium]
MLDLIPVHQLPDHSITDLQSTMNRLWIRISLVIIVVVIFGMLLPVAIGIATREFRSDEFGPPPEFSQDMDPEVLRERREARGDSFLPGRLVLNNLTPTLIGATIISIIAGILLSRSVSAPLSKLADAAHSIGQRDLTQRVEVRGTQEIREVARAFNEMAGDLQLAEMLRQNLLADVAHELRTPITVVQGNLQAILDDVYELDKAEIAQLYDQTRQLTHLVDDLRELAQAEARQLPMEMIPVEFGVLVAEVAASYEPLAENQGIELRTQTPEDLPPIQGDPTRLIQCLQNLLNNAFRHTPAGGSVDLRIQEQAGYVHLSISDNGAGISPEHLPHVFDRFYRVDPARTRQTGGTGLGLAITRAIITNHSGEITAQSEGEGQGSRFTVKLPVSSRP